MSSNTQATSPPHNGWGQFLLLSVLLGWALLIGFAFYMYGDVLKVISILGPFGAGAGGIFVIQDRIKKEYGEGRRKYIGCNALHWFHLLLIVWGLNLYYPVSAEKMFENIVAQVKDSMEVQKKKISGKAKYRDCPAIGRSLRSYQHQLTDSLLIASGIQEKVFPDWKRRVDSLVGNSVPEACMADWQQHFLEAVRSLAKRKAVNEVDQLMQRFGIALNAQAVGQVETERLRFGSIRNYLLRTVQGIQPMFIDAQPLFKDQFNPISEIVFIVNLNS